MKRHAPATPRRRAGAIVALTAILAIPLLGLLAFCIDTGYIHKVQDECQNVADSASLAGVARLADYASFTGVTDPSLKATLQRKAVAAAQAEAKKFVQANTAGNLTLNIDESSDVQVGYWNPAQKTFTATSPPDANWPNAVQVTVRRDNTNTSTSNGSLGLFFGSVLGLSSVNLNASATATLNPTPPQVSGLGSTDSSSSYSVLNPGGLLPFAVDVESYSYFLQHGTAGPGASVIDNYSTPTGLGSGNAVNSGDGIPEYQIYPPPDLIHPSQKGLLSFDPNGFSGNGNTISGWIDPGPSGSELLQNFGSSGFKPPQQLYGTPGNKVGHFDDLTGEIRLLPLIDYTQTTTGNQGQYYTVGVVAVQIVYGPDSNAIYAQPANIPVPSAIPGAAPPPYKYTSDVTGITTNVPIFGSTVIPTGYRQFQLVR